MIRRSEMLIELKIMEALNLGVVKNGQADLFAEVLNTADPDVNRTLVHEAVIRLAATRSTEVRGQFITPADLLETIRGINAETKRARAERLAVAKREHGDFTVHQAVTDPTEFLRFKQMAFSAFMGGASVEQAQAAAWAAIGRTPPPAEITTTHNTNKLMIGETL